MRKHAAHTVFFKQNHLFDDKLILTNEDSPYFDFEYNERNLCNKVI